MLLEFTIDSLWRTVRLVNMTVSDVYVSSPFFEIADELLYSDNSRVWHHIKRVTVEIKVTMWTDYTS